MTYADFCYEYFKNRHNLKSFIKPINDSDEFAKTQNPNLKTLVPQDFAFKTHRFEPFFNLEHLST